MVSLHIPDTRIRLSAQQAEYIYNMARNSADGLFKGTNRILSNESESWGGAIVAAGAKEIGSSVEIDGKDAMATLTAALVGKGALTAAVVLITVYLGNLIYDLLTDHPTLDNLRKALKEVEWLQNKVNNDIMKPLEEMVWKTRA